MSAKKSNSSGSTKPTCVELCTGIGGLSRGLQTSGFEHRLVVERDPDAVRTLRGNRISRRWPIHEGDLREIDLSSDAQGPVDLLAAGVPCQPFSQAGAGEGEKDDRNLFPEVVDAMRVLRPKSVLIENVRGLTRPGFARFLDYVSDSLARPMLKARAGESWKEHSKRLKAALEKPVGEASERYVVEWRPFDLADMGIPQKRARVLIVAVREDLAERWHWPVPTHSREALIAAKDDGAYWREHRLALRAIDLSERRIRELADSPLARRRRWRTLRDAIEDLPRPAKDQESATFNGHYAWPGARLYRGHNGSDLDLPSKTIKAGVNGVPGGEHIVLLDGGGHRYLTVRECARIQGLPDTLEFDCSRSTAMRQIGNAVPPAIGRIFGRRLKRCVTGDQPPEPTTEQDRAAGARFHRLVVDPDDGTIRTASIELKKELYASLRWGQGRNLYIGRVEGDDRAAKLRMAFNRVRKDHPELFEASAR